MLVRASVRAEACRTFVAMVVAQPRGRKRPWVEHFIEAVDYKGLTAYNDMQQDELLELLNAVRGNHFVRDAVDILEVVCRFHKRANVEVGRDGLKRSSRARGRHAVRVGEAGAWHWEVAVEAGPRLYPSTSS
jgi:hypothetical protein